MLQILNENKSSDQLNAKEKESLNMASMVVFKNSFPFSSVLYLFHSQLWVHLAWALNLLTVYHTISFVPGSFFVDSFIYSVLCIEIFSFSNAYSMLLMHDTVLTLCTFHFYCNFYFFRRLGVFFFSRYFFSMSS